MVKTLKCTTLLATALASWFALAAPSHAAPNPPAQPTVVDRADLDRALAHAESVRDMDREAIRSLLQRPDVRRIARDAGLEIERADRAVGTLSGPELGRLAAQARDLDRSLSGGRTIRMDEMTLIIILLLFIILLLVVD